MMKSLLPVQVCTQSSANCSDPWPPDCNPMCRHTRQPGANPKFRVGPIRMSTATVREILNRIVSRRKNGAWVVQQPPWNLDKDPSYGWWRVIEYDGNNGAKYSGLLQVWGLGLHAWWEASQGRDCAAVADSRSPKFRFLLVHPVYLLRRRTLE